MTFNEIELCLADKVLHYSLACQGYKIIEAVHDGRNVFTVYHTNGRYKIVWWGWDGQVGWYPKMVNGDKPIVDIDFPQKTVR